ncbi:hypothetical protein [Mucilaginibacter auburnensis]|uniref:Uncharacterized protein n=1 Tax=Mucilaginibacter auburnensis TaxID=1457233 RepID=A0A2H9VPL2_9SPHI|nr:hypothetical protein [Mucilaginibacter auburnensis]PJJ80252.1 hypothetical protein CLV57_3401 [Mucilaginibacter auburnensis]
MRVEHPAAFRFIINEDIYLLPDDKEQQSKKVVKVAEPAPISFNYLGNNQKKFLILTHYPDMEAIDVTHLTALEAILERKGYQQDDVAILNIARNAAGMEEIISYFSPERLLILGPKAIPAGMAEPQLNTLITTTPYRTLYSFCFYDMMDNKANKLTFWEQMKNL